jgi:hypothetical protein
VSHLVRHVRHTCGIAELEQSWFALLRDTYTALLMYVSAAERVRGTGTDARERSRGNVVADSQTHMRLVRHHKH